MAPDDSDSKQRQILADESIRALNVRVAVLEQDVKYLKDTVESLIHELPNRRG